MVASHIRKKPNLVEVSPTGRGSLYVRVNGGRMEECNLKAFAGAMRRLFYVR